MPTRVGGAAVLNSSTPSSSGYTATADFNVTGGATNVLVAVVLANLNAASATLSVTAEGVSMTQAAFISHPTGLGYPVGGIYYLMNPSPGLTTLAFTSGGVSLQAAVIQVEEWSGVDPADPLGATIAARTITGVIDYAITPEASGNTIISGGAQRLGATPPTGNWTPDAGVSEVLDNATGSTTAADIKVFAGYYTTVGTSPVDAAGRVTVGIGNMVVLEAEFRAVVPKVLPANGGSYSIGGTAAGLLRGRLVAATGGSYAITGAPATLIRPSPAMVAVGGSYALTGTAAGLLYGRSVAAVAGSYAITGTAAGLNRTIAPLAAVGGSYQLAGGGDGIGTAAVGSTLVVGGRDVELLYGQAVAAVSGSYAITGSPVALVKPHTVYAEAGDYFLSGGDATLVYALLGSYTIVANLGSYTISGSDVGWRYDRQLAAEAGAHTVTGTAAELAYGYVVVAEGGSYQLSGSSATLVHAQFPVFEVEAGSYVITGSNAGLVSSTVEIPPFLLTPPPADGGRRRKPKPRNVDPFDEITVIVDPDEGKTQVAEVPRAELKAALPDINKILDEADRVKLKPSAETLTIHPDDEDEVLQIMMLLAEIED